MKLKNIKSIIMISILACFLVACNKEKTIALDTSETTEIATTLSEVSERDTTESTTMNSENITETSKSSSNSGAYSNAAYIPVDIEKITSKDKNSGEYDNFKVHITSWGDTYLMKKDNHEFYPLAVTIDGNHSLEFEYVNKKGTSSIAPSKITMDGQVIAEYTYVKKTYGLNVIQTISINGNEVEYFSEEAYPDSGLINRYAYYTGFRYNDETYEYRMVEPYELFMAPEDYSEGYMSIYKGEELIGTYNFYGELIEGPGLPAEVDTLIHYGFGNIFISYINAVYDVATDYHDFYKHYDGSSVSEFMMIPY